MTIHLDHTIVPARDKTAAAKLLAEILGVTWSPASIGPFVAVYVNDGLTLDFVDSGEKFEIYHHCFRVSDKEFDAILGRIKAKGIPFRSVVHGEMDNKISTDFGGRGVYWNEPEGHYWEMLTVSYARQAK
jgi:hypothetical protein